MKFFYILGGNVLYGTEVVSINLIEGLRKEGHEVFCAVTTSLPAGESPVVRELKKRNIPYQTVYLGIIYLKKISWTIDTLRHLPEARRQMKVLLEKERPDVVVTPHYRTLAMIGKLLRKYRVIVNITEILSPGLAHRLYLKLAGKYVDLYFACSTAARSSLHQFGIAAEKTAVVYNGVDTREMPPLAEPTIKKAFQIGIVGRISHAKGHDIFVEAMALLGKKGYTIQAQVFGSGEQQFTMLLQKRIGELGLQPYFLFHGFIAEKETIYRELDVVVVPSRREAFGLVAAEPGYYQIPVVASRLDGLKEVVLEEVSGLLFEPENAEDLALQVERLITNPALANKLGANAKARVIENFTIDAMTNQLVELLQKKKPGGNASK